ncbi:hypothetical protein DAT35_10525 [Vitiosangium sp. GDMCC 1.1324]|nr:hypothetical protein DAT35_10525 [Vitiosangium sp. GDMCC 1.1324]
MEAQRFDAIDPAIEWAKQHRKEILAGTTIIIAGVAFLAFGGPGLLILAPAAAILLTSGLEAAPPDALKDERL